MKKYSLFLLTIVFLTFSSWTEPKSSILNTNSWSISIGNNEILASWLNNAMGDTAIIDKKKIKQTDTLFVERYLCGSDGNNSITTLTIKNGQNEIIKESTNKNTGLMYEAKMPLTYILNSPKFKDKQIVRVYFTIRSKTDKINQTVLLGKLKFK